MLILPDDVLDRVASFLSRKTLVALASVAKRLQSPARRRTVWKLRGYPSTTAFLDTMKTSTTLASSVRALTFHPNKDRSSTVYSLDSSFAFEAILLVLRECHELRRLRIELLPPTPDAQKCLTKAIGRIPTLKQLSLDCPDPFGPSSVAPVSPHPHALHLCAFPYLVQAHKSALTLLSACLQIAPSRLDVIPFTTPPIQTLTLSLLGFDDDTLFTLARAFFPHAVDVSIKIEDPSPAGLSATGLASAYSQLSSDLRLIKTTIYSRHNRPLLATPYLFALLPAAFTGVFASLKGESMTSMWRSDDRENGMEEVGDELNDLKARVDKGEEIMAVWVRGRDKFTHREMRKLEGKMGRGVAFTWLS
jgi:hypothetical protein